MIPVNIDHVKKFIQFAAKELKLPNLPQIKLVGSSENKYDAFGHSQGSRIVVRITDRHPIDIMRTIAHELIHYRDNILRIRNPDSVKEDRANLMAGRIMRKFDIAHPEVFKDKAVRANMLHEDGLGGSAVNCAGGDGVPGFSPLMGFEMQRKKRKEKTKALREVGKPFGWS